MFDDTGLGQALSAAESRASKLEEKSAALEARIIRLERQIEQMSLFLRGLVESNGLVVFDEPRR